VVRSLAWFVGRAGTVNVPSCVDPSVNCTETTPWNYTKLAATALVQGSQLSSLELIGDLPQIPDAALARDPSGNPTALFVQRQDKPLNGGSMWYAKGNWPTYPDATHTVTDYTFTSQANGDQLLAHTNDYGSYIVNPGDYNPDTIDPACSKSSGTRGDFVLNACHPLYKTIWGNYSGGGKPQRIEKAYTQGASYSTQTPDQPFAVTTYRLDSACTSDAQRGAGNCNSQFDKVDHYGYTGGANYHHTCQAVFAGGVVEGSAVNAANDTLTFNSPHGLRAGDYVQVYSPGSYYTLPGLTQYGWYYVIVVDANTIKLASSLSNAQLNIPVDITANYGCFRDAPNTVCGSVFVDAYKTTARSGTGVPYIQVNFPYIDHLIKHLEFYDGTGTTVTESYDYVYEHDANGQRCAPAPVQGDGLVADPTPGSIRSGQSLALNFHIPLNVGGLIMTIPCNGAVCTSQTGQNMCGTWFDMPTDLRQLRMTCTDTTHGTHQIVPNFYYHTPTSTFAWGQASTIWISP
jgi:hypothetical protein